VRIVHQNFTLIIKIYFENPYIIRLREFVYMVL